MNDQPEKVPIEGTLHVEHEDGLVTAEITLLLWAAGGHLYFELPDDAGRNFAVDLADLLLAAVRTDPASMVVGAETEAHRQTILGEILALPEKLEETLLAGLETRTLIDQVRNFDPSNNATDEKDPDV